MPSEEYEHLSARLDGLEGKIAELKNHNAALSSQKHILEAQIKEDAENIERLTKANTEHPLLKALVETVDEIIRERVKSGPGLPAQESQITTQEGTLFKMKTRITVKEDKRTLPEESTLTVRGKILRLVAEGKLEAGRRVSSIADMDPALKAASNLNVAKALDSLVDEQILLKQRESSSEKSNWNYWRHPDVEVDQMDEDAQDAAVERWNGQ